MPRSLAKPRWRLLAAVSAVLVTAAMLLTTGPTAGAQEPRAHWGPYQFGKQKANVRAFWLIDRTGDPRLNSIIKYVTDAWNSARKNNPQFPYIAVYRDNANVGRCFVNQTPGYSIASACMMRSLSEFGIKGIAATKGRPHFLGGAFAVSDGLSFKEAFTVVCHNVGHLLGLPDSDDERSCMKHEFGPGPAKWYGAGDARAMLDLYGHDDSQPPVAVADTYTTPEDVPLNVAVPGVLTNDSDVDGDPLSAVKVSDAANGSVTLNANGSFTYTPNANYNGSDSFTYKASAGGSDSEPVTVTVTVTPVPDVPVAVPESYTTAEDTPLNVGAPGVLGNDVDPEGGLSAVKVSDPAHGDLELDADGSFTYTPDENYHGPDSFTYKANDGVADSNTVTVSITVTPVNDAPVANADRYSTPQGVPLTVFAPGVLSNDSDVEGSALTAKKVSNPRSGTVTLNEDGSFLYTPNLDFSGVDSFTYKARDGSADSEPATVTITVQPVA